MIIAIYTIIYIFVFAYPAGMNTNNFTCIQLRKPLFFCERNTIKKLCNTILYIREAIQGNCLLDERDAFVNPIQPNCYTIPLALFEIFPLLNLFVAISIFAVSIFAVSVTTGLV